MAPNKATLADIDSAPPSRNARPSKPPAISHVLSLGANGDSAEKGSGTPAPCQWRPLGSQRKVSSYLAQRGRVDQSEPARRSPQLPFEGDPARFGQEELRSTAARYGDPIPFRASPG